MTEQLFKKAAVFTDIHLGEHLDQEYHLRDCLDFVEWFIGQSNRAGCDTIIFLGDFFHSQKQVNLLTLSYARRIFDLLDQSGLPVYVLVGNHDIFYRSTRSVHGLDWVDLYRNIHLINEVTEIGGCILAPWVIGPEYVLLTEKPSKYVFAHLELPLFLANRSYEFPDRGGIHADQFTQTEGVFTGHFHRRQCKVNSSGILIWYVGNPFGHNWSDLGDRDRGMMILDWDGVPEFLNWEAGPTFDEIPMSLLLELLENEKFPELFNHSSTLRVHDDLHLDTETLLSLKESISRMVRSVSFPPREPEQQKEEPNIEIANTVSVSEVVVQALSGLDTQGGRYDAELLVEMFLG